ncbi:hypothetical protein [Arthrobacter sp. B0490]|uniref:hypothetical protein n=1 Tax=Arthrobacter sp. B0490 TaxID=2058891 RepID=UPI0011B001E8|nr:hypothetical protein [Arthrobacter sp. B0490]
MTTLTVVTGLLFSAGVFGRVISALARLARGRVVVLWLVAVLLAVACTAFSPATTAVLLLGVNFAPPSPGGSRSPHCSGPSGSGHAASRSGGCRSPWPGCRPPAAAVMLPAAVVVLWALEAGA